MNAILKRFTSRKFWLAVGAFITLVANGQYTEAVAVVMTYITAEGVADTATRLKTTPSDDEDVIVAGPQ